jgi:hypothetical protein
LLSAAQGQVGPAASPEELGAAYREVVANQSTTLSALGDAFRRVQNASSQFELRVQNAIGGLAVAIAAARRDRMAIAAYVRAYDRDLQILGRGTAIAGEAEQGLQVALGVEDQAVITAETDITNGLFTSLPLVVGTTTATGNALARAGRERADAVVQGLAVLGSQLSGATATGPVAR